MHRPFDWAMPIKSYPWAVVAAVTDRIKRVSGYRILVTPAHRAWERAVGVR